MIGPSSFLGVEHLLALLEVDSTVCLARFPEQRLDRLSMVPPLLMRYRREGWLSFLHSRLPVHEQHLHARRERNPRFYYRHCMHADSPQSSHVLPLLDLSPGSYRGHSQLPGLCSALLLGRYP